MPDYDAFLLVSFGGPQGPDDVMPFLENVTRGRGVPRERLEEVSHHYLALGGVSPINDQNRALIEALRREFDARQVGLPIYWGNRNWEPFLAPTLARIHADGHRSVLALATSAYASYSGCRQYREDLARALAEAGLAGGTDGAEAGVAGGEDGAEAGLAGVPEAPRLSIDKLRHYFDHPGFVRPFAEGLADALRQLAAEGHDPDHVEVVFTTHSIPSAMAATSGPPARRAAWGPGGAYEAQHLATAACVVEEAERRGLRVPGWRLAYQSRSGSPQVPWLEPDINDALRDVAADGIRAVVVVPIGFISDHVEVTWDLDREAAATCAELGLRMARVATPGTHPAFVAAIVDLVQERRTGGAAAASSDLGPWPAVCAAGCCPNPRASWPACCGED